MYLNSWMDSWAVAAFPHVAVIIVEVQWSKLQCHLSNIFWPDRAGCGTQDKHAVTHRLSHMQTPFAASWVLLAYEQGNKQSEGMRLLTRTRQSAKSHPAPRSHDLWFYHCTDRQRQEKKKSVLPDFSPPWWSRSLSFSIYLWFHPSVLRSKAYKWDRFDTCKENKEDAARGK